MRADADGLTKASFIFGAFGMRRPVRDVVGFRGRSNIVGRDYDPPEERGQLPISTSETWPCVTLPGRRIPGGEPS
jgi:hypothetical protein